MRWCDRLLLLWLLNLNVHTVQYKVGRIHQGTAKRVLVYKRHGEKSNRKCYFFFRLSRGTNLCCLQSPKLLQQTHMKGVGTTHYSPTQTRPSRPTAIPAMQSQRKDPSVLTQWPFIHMPGVSHSSMSRNRHTHRFFIHITDIIVQSLLK